MQRSANDNAQDLGTGINLEPRIFRLFCQRLVALRDSGRMEFLGIVFDFFTGYFQNNKSSKNSKKFHYPRVSPGNEPLAKKPEDSGFEFGQGHDKPQFLSYEKIPGQEPMTRSVQLPAIPNLRHGIFTNRFIFRLPFPRENVNL